MRGDRVRLKSAPSTRRRTKAAVRNRSPNIHDLRLWPLGLRAARATHNHSTRCEPDFVLLIEFSTGAPVVISGEMKWDWRINPGDQGFPCGYDSQDLGGCAPCGIWELARSSFATPQQKWGASCRPSSRRQGRSLSGLRRCKLCTRDHGAADLLEASQFNELSDQWELVSLTAGSIGVSWRRIAIAVTEPNALRRARPVVPPLQIWPVVTRGRAKLCR